MSLWLPLETVQTNLGFPFEILVLLIITIAGLIFYAKDFKIGLLLHFFAFSATFIWFYQWSLTDSTILWQYPLILSILCIIGLSISLYAVKSQSAGGSLV